MKYCFYCDTVNNFCTVDKNEWFGSMQDAHHEVLPGLALGVGQLNAWRDCYKVLQPILCEITQKNYHIVFEYLLPFEDGRRPDVVLVSDKKVIILEFKQKMLPALMGDIDQAKAYNRDIKEYHFESRDKEVKTYLVLTKEESDFLNRSGDITIVSKNSLLNILKQEMLDGNYCDVEKWIQSRYDPLPSIIDAAQRIMRNEELPDIRRVKATNIPKALETLKRLTVEAKDNVEHKLVMITGVPGAGKTFLGLQYVYDVDKINVSEDHALYLSGNGPLIDVLTSILKSVYVGGVHKYLSDPDRAGLRHVLVFDEGQRAWTAEQMRAKESGTQSEAERFLRIGMAQDWSILVILVGEGQEINTGEIVDLSEWVNALNNIGGGIQVHCPTKLRSYFPDAKFDDDLALVTSLRTHLAEDVSECINSLLDGDIDKTYELSERVKKQGFNMYVTRDLDCAENYCRLHYFNERGKKYGLMRSSKPSWSRNNSFGRDSAYNPRFKYGKWYNDTNDREWFCGTFNYTVTEFGCQGLEVDMPIVYWNTDLRWYNGWHAFVSGGRGQRAADIAPTDIRYHYRINTYRVLLSRGRDGVVVYVPSDCSGDSKIEFDKVYRVLRDAGFEELV